MPDEKLHYPIGRFTPSESYTPEEIADLITTLEKIPEKIAGIAKSLTPMQLNTSYRPGGWTARQVIHHIADSHMNAYIRFKWTLTEDSPTIKAYNEKAWAETPEVQHDPALSVALLTALHAKWVVLLQSLSKEDLKKYFVHPETRKQITLERTIALYAWHGEHHLGHLRLISKS